MSDTVTITLNREQVSALLDVFESAQRGREDVEYLASLGDYDASDIATARQRHQRELDVESAIRRQL